MVGQSVIAGTETAVTEQEKNTVLTFYTHLRHKTHIKWDTGGGGSFIIGVLH